MANITLYKPGGKTKTISEGGAAYAIRNYGWSRTPISSPAPVRSSGGGGGSSAPTNTSSPANTSSSSPKPNAWNPNTTTVYSSSGSAKEIPISSYNTYVNAGWGTSAPTPTQVPEPEPTPQVVNTSDQIRAEEKANESPYIQYAGSPDVFKKEGDKLTHITAEQAAGIPDFRSQVYKSPDAKPEGLKTPVQSIQEVFGANWQPGAAFTPELQAQGIYGAVRVGNDVYTIGPGGGYESQETFESKFGTRNQSGIVEPVDYDQAKALGITIKPETLEEPLDNVKTVLDPDYSAEENAATAERIRIENERKAEVDSFRKKVDDMFTKMIDTMSKYTADLTKARTDAKDAAGLEKKSQAITDAQTAANNLDASYSKEIERQKSTGRSMQQINGRQAKLRGMRAVEMTPLLAAIQIAQGNYDRADDIYDDAVQDWKDGKEMEFQMTQMNLDKLGTDLTSAQAEARDATQTRLQFEMNDYNRKLDTIKEVKELSMLYNAQGANITVGDSWEDAYRKASPYIKSEQDLKNELAELNVKLAKKNLNKSNVTSYAPSSNLKLYNELGGEAGTGMTFNEWYNDQKVDNDYTDSDIKNGMIDSLKSDNKIGQDEKVSWKTYKEMYETWYFYKGSSSGFNSTFPQNIYMDSDNIYEYNNQNNV